jgi:hypothetical protein
MERVWRRDYANQAKAIDITEYIVGFCNNERLHSKPGYLPPTVYERTMASKPPIEVSGISWPVQAGSHWVLCWSGMVCPLPEISV